MATIQELTMQADRGNADAMCTIARSYAQGTNGLTVNYDMATYWFEKAAAKDARYEIDLGLHYFDSSETALREQGFAILRKAGESGISRAFFYLGQAYHASRGTKSDPEKAKYWYAKAIVKGVHEAYHTLGVLFDQRHDYKYAMACFYQGAQKGNSASMAYLSVYYHDGVCSEPDYAKAFTYAKKSADSDHPDGLTALGICYYHGHGVAEDKNRAYQLFAKASSTYRTRPGINDYYLGLCYFHGHGTAWDQDRGHSYFSKASSWYTPAMYMLGYSHCNRRLQKRDEKAGANCYKIAADAGYAPAMTAYAQLCISGQYGIGRDYAAAVRYYKVAADAGNQNAQAALSRCYANGWGVPCDPEKMRYWSECADGLRRHCVKKPAFDPSSLNPIQQILPEKECRSELSNACDVRLQNISQAAAPKPVSKTVTVTTTYYPPAEQSKPAEPKKMDWSKITTKISIPDSAVPTSPKPTSAPVSTPKPVPAPSTPKAATAEERKQAAALALQGIEKYRQAKWEEVFKLASQAVELDRHCTKGNLLLGWMYHHGLYVKEDKQKAIHYFQTPTDADPMIYNCIGCYHYFGWGGKPVNKKEALWYFSYAATRNHLTAMCNAATCFGEGVSLNDKDSKHQTDKYSSQYWEKAAELGSMRACVVMQMEHLMDRSPRLLNKYKDMYERAKKKTSYQGVIEAEKRALSNLDRISMGLLME